MNNQADVANWARECARCSKETQERMLWRDLQPGKAFMVCRDCADYIDHKELIDRYVAKAVQGFAQKYGLERIVAKWLKDNAFHDAPERCATDELPETMNPDEYRGYGGLPYDQQ